MNFRDEGKSMQIRQAEQEDLEQIMEIIEDGRRYLKLQGVEQWQDGNPDIGTIQRDISNQESFLFYKEGKCVATAMVSVEADPTYEDIEGGAWLSDEVYCVIHRLAIDEGSRGGTTCSEIFELIEDSLLDEGISSIKIDTHQDNMPMQKVLKKRGFSYCGIIYLAGSDSRLAFEKIIS